MAVNNGNEDKAAEVLLDGDFLEIPCWQVRDLVNGQEWTVNLHESGRLIVRLPRKDGIILHLQGVLAYLHRSLTLILVNQVLGF